MGKPLYDDIPPENRHREITKRRLDRRENLIPGRCSECVLLKEFCACSRLDTLPKFDAPAVTVVMHNKEKFKCSNTVKIISKIIVGSETLIDGIDDDRITQLSDGNSFILYPSEDAVGWAELPGGRDRVIVLDGTWRQAKRFNKILPLTIPRVKIQPQTLSKFLCRTQVRLDRVCTVEALALLMEDMGRPEIAESLEAGLQALQEQYNLQCFGTAERPENRMKAKPKH